MSLEREPNPQPAPLPKGAVGRDEKVKAVAIIVGVIIFVAMAVWLLWPKSSKGSVIGPNRVMQPQSTASPIALDMEKEKAFEDGKREAAKQYLGVMNAQNQPPAVQAAPAYYPPAQRVQTEADSVYQKASFADNMVTNGRFGLDRTTDKDANRLGSNVNLPAPAAGNSSRDADKAISEIADNVLPEGTLVYCALVNQLSGENTGPVKVQVSNDVYFPDSRDIAIPQGAIILGEAQKVGAQFQQRLAVSFHSLQIGNKQVRLDKMPGLDQQGAAALHDKVDNHYAQIFGASLAVGAIGGLSQIGNGSYGGVGGYDASTQIRNGISQSTAQSSAQILNHFLNRMPTLTIRPGTPVVVYLTGNVEVPQ